MLTITKNPVTLEHTFTFTLNLQEVIMSLHTIPDLNVLISVIAGRFHEALHDMIFACNGKVKENI